MRNKDHEDAGKILDNALSSYCDNTPLSGLEQRILNRIRLADTSRRRRTRVLGYACELTVASLAVMAVIAWTRFDSVSKNIDLQAVSVAVPYTHPVPPSMRLAPHIAANLRKRSHRRSRITSRPFPTITSLTIEERGLLVLVERNPGELQLDSAAAGKWGGDPIDIQVIEIPPLQIDGAQ